MILLEVGTGKDPNAGSARQYVHRQSIHRAGRTPAHPKLRTILPDGYFPGTFGELAASYMSQHVWLYSKAPRHYETDLKRDLLPRWKDRPLAEIGRAAQGGGRSTRRDRRTGCFQACQQPEEPPLRHVQLGHGPRARDYKLWKHNAAVREDVGFSFNPHDLRRTASTHLARLGVRDEVRKAVLNHKKKRLRGVYNLYEYDREKREALEFWADAVMSAVVRNGRSLAEAA